MEAYLIGIARETEALRMAVADAESAHLRTLERCADLEGRCAKTEMKLKVLARAFKIQKLKGDKENVLPADLQHRKQQQQQHQREDPPREDPSRNKEATKKRRRRDDDDEAPPPPRPPPPPPKPFVQPYHRGPVRKKQDRAKLPGHSCKQCEAFLAAACKGLSKEDQDFLRDKCSRHRAHFKPPKTPPGFWDLSFPDSVRSNNH